MYIAHKSNTIKAIHDVEWECRKKAKGLTTLEYWPWLESVTSVDEKGFKSYDFSGEDYEIVETNELLSYVDSEGRTLTYQESGHIVSDLDGTHYHLKWVENDDGVLLESGDKLLLETGGKILDEVVIKGIVKDDDALAAYQLAEKWKRVRFQRDRLLNETDWIVTKATETETSVSSAWKSYRQALRDVPSQSDPDNITWPTKPS